MRILTRPLYSIIRLGIRAINTFTATVIHLTITSASNRAYSKSANVSILAKRSKHIILYVASVSRKLTAILSTMKMVPSAPISFLTFFWACKRSQRD